MLDKNCTEVNFKKGEIIFKQNMYSLNVGYLKEGLVKLHMKGLAGKEQIIKIAKSPTYIGIPTAIGDKINKYSATAIEDCSVCFIDLEIFKSLILSNPQFAYEIILNLCENELTHFKNCLHKTQKNARGLVADTILNFADKIYENKTFVLPLTRSEIADLINSSRELVSRILSEFNNDGIIDLDGKKVTIISPELLIKISENG
jgi:CRP/FNR family transcriptional regulator